MEIPYTVLIMNDVDFLEQNAVDAAINAHWQIAIDYNKKISRLDKKNLGAQLRLGYAYIQLHKLKEAKTAYKKVLRLQKGNQIAEENLERIKILELRGAKKPPKKDVKLDPNLFLELPGKTKSSTLVNLGQKNTLAHLVIGQEIFVKPKKRRMEIRTEGNDYVGALPDDLSKRLFLFMKAGSQYMAFIKDVSLSRIVVFIREEKRGKKVQRYSSFPRNIQVDMAKVSTQEGSGDEEGQDEDVLESDLEKLAETLSSDEKDLNLMYQAESRTDDEDQEE